MEDFKKHQFESWLAKESSSKTFVSRDINYLKYKLKLNSKLIKLKSGVAWVSFENNEILIGDLFGENFELILKELIAFAEKAGFEVLSFSSPNKNLVQSLIDRFDFEKVSSIPLIIYSLDNKIKDENFQFTGGDFDTF